MSAGDYLEARKKEKKAEYESDLQSSEGNDCSAERPHRKAAKRPWNRLASESDEDDDKNEGHTSVKEKKKHLPSVSGLPSLPQSFSGCSEPNGMSST